MLLIGLRISICQAVPAVGSQNEPGLLLLPPTVGVEFEEALGSADVAVEEAL